MTWENNIEMLENVNKSVTFSLSSALSEDFIVSLNTTHEHSSSKLIHPIIYPYQVIYIPFFLNKTFAFIFFSYNFYLVIATILLKL